MKQKQKKRCEIEEKYKWDLSSIYKNEKIFNEDIEQIKKDLLEMEKYKDKNINNETILYEFLNLYFGILRKIEKVIEYAALNNLEDMTNSKSQELYGRALSLGSEVSSKVSFVTNKILDLDKEDIKNLINDKKIEDYKFLLEDIFRQKSHILSDSEEEILSSLSKSLDAVGDAYDNLVDADMKFGNIKNEYGEEIELTHSNFYVFLKSKDRRVRRDTFNTYYSTYGKYKTTISGLYSSHLETNNIITKLRNYNSMLDENLFSDNLPRDVYTNLINTVNDNLNILHKYYEMKKSILNLDEFHIYDNGAPVTKAPTKKYSYDDAKKIILDTFKIMGDDYVCILNKAFNERWIDVYNNEGKASGAFSSGVYESNPFILTNYEEKLDDISALSHELGHSVHTYLSKENNIFPYFEYSLFIAEVASLTNEIIFNKTMLKNETDRGVKLYIIDNLIKLFVSNLFDATLYAEFELNVHTMIEEGKTLTSDYYNDLCYNLNCKYYGDNVVVDENIKYRWEIYNHLYNDFYLYKYATGISCACFCATQILNGDKEFLEKYKNFLKLGGSVYPKDALLTIGIDITNKDFIVNSINFFNGLLEEFKNINDSIK